MCRMLTVRGSLKRVRNGTRYVLSWRRRYTVHFGGANAVHFLCTFPYIFILVARCLCHFAYFRNIVDVVDVVDVVDSLYHVSFS